jgi:hypothetical protein
LRQCYFVAQAGLHLKILLPQPPKFWDDRHEPPHSKPDQKLQVFFFSWGLNSGLSICKPVVIPLEPHFQFIVLWLFWRWDHMKYLPRLALNHDPPRSGSQSFK